MNMDQERPSGPAHRPSVPELRVLITLGPETMERSKELDHGLAHPHLAMTHHNLDYSIHFPFIISLYPPFHLHHLY